jgi:imidazolonepropionase-like amidohydrolase
MHRRIGFTAVAAFTLAAITAAPTRAQVVAYEDATIIDGTGAAPIANGTIVVNNNRITAVGRNVPVPAGATIVNLAGKSVMPDLIDTHTHLSQTRDEVIKDLARRAYWGVSAANSMGTDETEIELSMQGKESPGLARVTTAWHGITRPEPGRTMAPYWINSAAEGRKAVDELAAKHVEIVKVWVDDRDGKYQKLTPEMYGAIIDEAHKNNLRVTAHIFKLEDAKGLLKANVDAFAHSVRDRDVDDEFMALIKEHPKLVVNPNLPPRGVKTDVSWLQGHISAAEMAQVEKANLDNPKAQAFYGIQSRNLKRLNAAGVTIVLGTDGDTPWAPHTELEDMVIAGLTPMQAIEAGTKNAAEFLHIADAGTLQAGKSADFIVLDANPLDDITNTRKIDAVYLYGKKIDRSKYP